jgi:hypothetical protein
MRSHVRSERANRLLSCLLVTWAVWLGFPAAPAEAQVVQDCQPSQYLDRTAPGADRQLSWDFSVVSDPERCLQVRVGQTVTWSGDFDTHPLAGQGGDGPNPIFFHQNGAVTFNSVGTFGFVCLSHSAMKGAIRVVQGPPPASVPALSPWLAAGLTVVLLASGLLIRNHRRRGATVGS